jgi:uncharacterized membrane protein YsdA (DUF1294 family)
MEILIWMTALSAIAFVAYGWDKLQAKRGGWRISEKTLHGLALAGGFVGAWLGMRIFHHKTRKPQFRTVMLISAVLWLALLTWSGLSA